MIRRHSRTYPVARIASIIATMNASLRRGLNSRWITWLLVSCALVALAHVLDPFAWRVLRKANVYDTDWGRLLRIAGYLPTWAIIAFAVWRQRRDAREAWLIIGSPTLGGALAELAKLVVRRLRPDPDTFGYAFRAFSDGPFSNRGLGMPSSHTLVAFAAAAMLAARFPRAAGAFYLMAVGCALTRVMANAHYLSDTVAAACLGWAVAQLLVARWGRTS